MRDLAQPDARLFRGLQQELSETSPLTNAPAALLDGDPPASREELERLSVATLWSLCKGRGIKGLSGGPKPKQIDALLSHPDGPPLRSALPVKGSKAGTTAGRTAAEAGAAELQALEQRLNRLEQLVLLIAQQVGEQPAAIARLLPPAAPEA